MILKIKPVSTRSKLDVLREFGHRVFVEIGDDGKPIGNFVEFKDQMSGTSHEPKRTEVRRSPVKGNVALMYSGSSLEYREGSITERVRGLCVSFAARPTRRADLVSAIAKETSLGELQVSNAISALTIDKILIVPG